MVVKVSPNESLPTHHVRLSYGGIDIGLILTDSNGKANPRAFQRSSYPRTALKMYSGDATYSDSEPPFTPISQIDWANGRAHDNHDSDRAAFYDSRFANTSRSGEVVCGGMETPALLGAGDSSWNYGAGGYANGYPLASTWGIVTLTGSNRFMATRYTATSTTAMQRIDLVVRCIGSPSALSYGIYADNAGSPNLSVNFATGALGTGGIEKEILDRVSDAFDTTSALVIGTQYWIVVYAADTDNTANHWDILCHDKSAASYVWLKASTAGSSWVQTQYHLVYAITVDGDYGAVAKFFNYKGQLYVALWNRLFINGYQGVAQAAGSDSTHIAVPGTPWAIDEWKGCSITVFEGTGAGWLAYPGGVRRVVSNTANVLELDKVIVTPDATTVFNILGSNKWTEITGHGLASVYDVATVNGHVYFAQGDDFDIRRARFYNSAGTWTAAYAAEAGLRGGFIKVQPDGAVNNLWWASQGTNNAYHTVCVAEGSALGAATTIAVGDTATKITGLEVYGEDSSMWVFKEEMIYEMKYDTGTSAFIPYKFKLDEISSMKDYRNGWAHIQHNVYLYFSMQNTLQRYYSNSLDSVGLDLGTGMEDKYVGHSECLIGYPSRLINIVVGQRSSIYMHNGQGWHNLYTCGAGYFNYHERIRNGIIQTVPGDATDRLWFCMGPYAMWIPIALDPYNVPVETYGFYPFRWESWFITSWFYVQMTDVVKFWYSLKLVTENLAATRPIYVDYQIDTDTTWHELGAYTTSFYQEKAFSATNDLTARRLRLRVRMQTLDNRYSPKLISTVIEAITRVAFKYQTSLTFRLADDDHDLQGEREPMTRAQKSAQLQAWAAQAAPVRIYAVSDEFDGGYVLVEPASYRVLSTIPGPDGTDEIDICQINLLEV